VSVKTHQDISSRPTRYAIVSEGDSVRSAAYNRRIQRRGTGDAISVTIQSQKNRFIARCSRVITMRSDHDMAGRTTEHMLVKLGQ